jgi:hypothetical protein
MSLRADHAFARSLLLVSLIASPLRADITLPRAGGAVTVDGDLSEPAWKAAAVIDQFYEYQRSDNGPSPVPTTAYVMYDDRNLYVGIDCRDPEPSKIRAPYVDRDQVFGDQDNVVVLIDARGEGKVALQLRTNPRGIQGDAVNNDSTGSEDFSPDFFYDTAAKITPQGWVAEYRIPLSTLRYTEKEPQTWGIIVLRNWPRDFRYTVSSSPLPRGSNCFICHSIQMTGITGLPSSQHLIAAPYVSAQQAERPREGAGRELVRGGLESDVGLDLKWSPTSDTALDGTINPDFSQIESDVAQIAANQRFALFYAEKRPFFLEGSDLFQSEIDAVYTRTITSPRWGARGTGKRGSTTWTLLATEDRGGGLLVLPGPFGSSFAAQDAGSVNVIGRARHELGTSAVGLVLTARQGKEGSGYNRVFGPDLEWRPTDKDTVTAQVLVSDTDDPYLDGTGVAAEVEWRHTRREWDFELDYEDYGSDFRADHGFVPRVGYRELAAGGGWNFYPKDAFWIQVRADGGLSYVTDREGERIGLDPNIGFSLRGKKNLAVFVVAHPGQEIAIPDPVTGVLNRFDSTYLEYAVTLNPSARWPNFGVNGRAGDDVDFANQREARSVVANFSSTFRPVPRLQTEVTWSHEQLDTRGGDDPGRLYTAAVQRLKVTYSFTAKSLLRVIGQYVETDYEPGRYVSPVPETEGSFLGSLLYSYKLNWQTVLFVGFGDDRVLDERAALVPTGRTLFAKVSYAIQR